MGGSSYRRLCVGPHLVGLVGLEDLFARLCDAGRVAEAGPVPDLLAGARHGNYIPEAAALYGEALLQAYRRYPAERSAGKPAPGTARTWRGLPREQVPWFPTRCADRGDGCGRCHSFCPNGVFALAPDGALLEVAEPLACQVGCSACAAACPREAIAFPHPAVLEALGQHRREPCQEGC